jgi:hypothetical protein
LPDRPESLAGGRNTTTLGPVPGLEQEATALTHFSMYFVNGLLDQDYARTIIKTVNPNQSEGA